MAEAGATYVAACALRLRRTARDRYLPFIAAEFPHLAERYRRAYAHGHQVSDTYRAGLRRFFARMGAKYGVATREYEDAEESAADAAPSDQLGLGL